MSLSQKSLLPWTKNAVRLQKGEAPGWPRVHRWVASQAGCFSPTSMTPILFDCSPRKVLAKICTSDVLFLKTDRQQRPCPYTPLPLSARNSRRLWGLEKALLSQLHWADLLFPLNSIQYHFSSPPKVSPSSGKPYSIPTHIFLLTFFLTFHNHVSVSWLLALLSKASRNCPGKACEYFLGPLECVFQLCFLFWFNSWGFSFFLSSLLFSFFPSKHAICP